MASESFDCIVQNAVVVTATDTGPYDIGIRSGKISVLAAAGALSQCHCETRLDAEGAFVTPGGIDAHVHLAESGISGGRGQSADDYTTGTRSAVAGGTTTVVTFACQRKSDASLLEVLNRTKAQAAGNAYCDYSFHMLLSNPTASILREFPLIRQKGISSIKVFMTYEDLQIRDDQMLEVLLHAQSAGHTTLIHAENGDMLRWMTQKLEERGLVAPKYHVTSRPQTLEIEATSRAIHLSQIIPTPIVIVHVSSPSAARIIRRAQTRGHPVFAETCPQYLFLTREDLDKPGFEGAKCVCSPPPREDSSDHEGIWTGLQNGTFSILSSDHCPFVYDDEETGKKSAVTPEHPEGRFRYIPNGCPGVETRLPLVKTAGRLQMNKFGALIPGISDADLTIWSRDLEPFQLTNELLHHNVDYTPYEGHRITEWPRYTLVRGKVVWDRRNGGVVGAKGFGKFLERDRSEFFNGLPPWNIAKF
ncbi:aminohydrolase [Annulohypoxylon moriforme]|nr:aminohydrolase [Annulohypoxylon moriforme]